MVLTQDTEVMLTVTMTVEQHPTPPFNSTSKWTEHPEFGGVFDDKGNVKLTWSWTGETVAFNIFRNDNLVGTTEAMTLKTSLHSADATPTSCNRERRACSSTVLKRSVLLDAFAVEEPGLKPGLVSASGP